MGLLIISNILLAITLTIISISYGIQMKKYYKEVRLNEEAVKKLFREITLNERLKGLYNQLINEKDDE